MAPGGARATNGVTVMEGMRALRGRTVGNLPSSLPPWRASIPTSSAASRMATSSRRGVPFLCPTAREMPDALTMDPRPVPRA